MNQAILAWSFQTDKGTATDVVYLDFAQAFDKVPTEQLMKKVESHKI